MKIALVSGANKGIGLETARLLARLDYFVYVGARDAESGARACAALHEEGLRHASPITLDVTLKDTIAAARVVIEQRWGHLDVLINNAGILGQTPQPAAAFPVEAIREIFETNFFGAIQLTQEMIPLLKKSVAGRIVNVTSDLSSLTLHQDPSWKYYPFKSTGYGLSKTALNGYTIMLAYGLRDTAIKVNAVNPGHTATDFNQFRGKKTPAEAAALIVPYACLPEDGPSGGFFGEAGEMPW
jgi:NAD(P)-dependent dehydrogenase (short-subunit alcohol dehydrogenase family)